uniref:Putative tick kunitz 49 n=1 Tax=Amblyomma triste TaxID=251400 RepID=A0A023G9M0_AMBTT
MLFCTILVITLFGLFASGAPPTHDQRCEYYKKPTSACNNHWVFNKKSKVCEATCDTKAKFSTKTACDGYCRSRAVCKAARPVPSCSPGSQVTVYYYDTTSKTCQSELGCGYTGNNFPTLKECKETCEKGNAENSQL